MSWLSKWFGGDAGSDTKTSTATSAPWKPYGKFLQYGMQNATDLYDKGLKTFVDPSTTRGLRWEGDWADRGSAGFRSNWNDVSDLARQGGLDSLQKQSVRGFQDIADDPVRTGVGALNDVQKSALGQMQGIAAGNEMRDNPYLNDVINRSSEDIRDQVGLSAAGAGRYGSGVHQGVLADSIGDMASQLRFSDYQGEQARRDAAIQGVAGMGNTANDQFQQAMARRTDAFGSLYNAGQQQRQNVYGDTDALSSAYQAGLQPADTRLSIGQTIEGQKNAAQDAPWRALSLYQGMGGGDSYGTKTQTDPRPSAFSRIVGGGIAGLGSTGSPWGALLGAGAGYYG